MKPSGVLTAMALLAGMASAEEQPPSPLQRAGPASQARWGYVVLSDGTRLDGRVSTTPGKSIRIFERSRSAFVEVGFDKVRSIEQVPEKEWLEQEWRWAESGSDRKVFTDRFYRAAEYRTDMTLKTGERLAGDAVAPIFVEAGGKRRLLELHKRFKSDQPARKEDLKPLVYITKLVLTDEPPKENAPAGTTQEQEPPASEGEHDPVPDRRTHETEDAE